MSLSSLPSSLFWLIVAGLVAVIGARFFGRAASRAGV